MRALQLLKDGNLASGAEDNLINIWVSKRMELVAHCKGHTKPVWSVVGMQDGRFISGSEDKTMKIW